MNAFGSFEVRADQLSGEYKVVRWGISTDRMNNIKCTTIRRFFPRGDANRSLRAIAKTMNAEVREIGGNLTFDIPAPVAPEQ